MKKIVFIIILMCSIMNICLAMEPANLVSLTNKCSIVDDNEVTLHVEVITVNEGLIAKLTDRFTFGRITNREDMIVSFSDVESDYYTQVTLDTLRDENDRSNLSIYFDKDILLSKNETLLSFNINIKFQGDIPNSLYILGNDILLSNDASVCENINGYKTEVIKTDKVIEKQMTSFYVIIGIIVVICLIEFIIILRSFRRK